MMSGKKRKFWAVRGGPKAGVYEDRHSASNARKGSKDATCQRFDSKQRALQFCRGEIVKTKSINFRVIQKGQSTRGLSSSGMKSSFRKASRKRKQRPKKKHRSVFRDVSKVVWNEKQRLVIDRVMKGKNVFFTGPAGSGKSLVIEKIRQELSNVHGHDRVYVTATTGISAVNINGITVHRWSGIGYENTFKAMLERAMKKSRMWKKTRVLIIDEVSMLDGSLFENLDKIGRSIRRNTRPFGGIQLVVSGDFFQLPPVGDSGKSQFCFETTTWSSLSFLCIRLTEIYRQQDVHFVQVLSHIRKGHVTDSVVRTLQNCMRPLPSDGVEPTRLYSTNRTVNSINEQRLALLKGTEHVYRGQDHFLSGETSKKLTDDILASMLDHTQALRVLRLKRGAQVILTQNLTDQLVNGSRGTVTGFRLTTNRFAHMQKMKNGGTGPAPQGQGNNLYKNMFQDEEQESKNWKEEHEFYSHDFYRKKGHSLVPLVRFPSLQGQIVPIDPVLFTLKNREYRAIRVQIPLKCAWALTIHKCQGLSIDRAEISMREMFCAGHFYVAISRVRTLRGLRIVDEKPDWSKVRADGRVVRFMRDRFGMGMEGEANATSEGEYVPMRRRRKRKRGKGKREEEEEEIVVGKSKRVPPPPIFGVSGLGGAPPPKKKRKLTKKQGRRSVNINERKKKGKKRTSKLKKGKVFGFGNMGKKKKKGKGFGFGFGFGSYDGGGRKKKKKKKYEYDPVLDSTDEVVGNRRKKKKLVFLDREDENWYGERRLKKGKEKEKEKEKGDSRFDEMDQFLNE